MSDDTTPSPTRAAPRDRDERGRPEQARPRDRTGRPLPYDTDVVERTEEHEYATLDEALRLGVELWGSGRYFEAHECLEAVWHQAAPGDGDFWKGVIQVAVGAVHVQRDNPDGAVALWRRAADHLDGYPATHHGVDAARLRASARADADAVEAAGLAAVGLPSLPTTADGPFVGAAPDDPPVPFDRVPPWAPRGGPDAVPAPPTARATTAPRDEAATTDLAAGLRPDNRFRCTACGNLTRFDVTATERTRRFHHLELGGVGRVEEEEVLDRTVEQVACRWCGRDDAIAVEPVAGGPAAAGSSAPG